MGDLFDDDPSASVSLFSTISAKQNPNSLPEVPPPLESKPVESNQEPKPNVEAEKPKEKVAKQPTVFVEAKAQRSVAISRPKDNVRRTITHIQQNINQRFDELFNIVEALTPKEHTQGVVLSNENILRRIQKEVNDSKEKDSLLSKKQTEIDGMMDSVAEKEERNQLRRKIAEITEEIAAEIEKFTEAQSDLDYTNSQIERSRSELEQTESRNAFNEQRMRVQFDREIAKFKDEVEQLRVNSEKNIKKFNEEKEKLSVQIIKFKKENEKLELLKPKVSQKDLDAFQSKVTDKLKEIIQSIVIDSYNMLNDSIDKEIKYSGKMVQTTMKKALQNEAEKFLS